MELTINGKKIEAIFSLETLVLYEEEFGRDLIQDVMGKATLDPKKEAEEQANAQNGIITIDYTQTNWTGCIRALWAGMKIADPSIPRFKAWVANSHKIDVAYVSSAIVPEVIDKFFRQEEVEQEEQGR